MLIIKVKEGEKIESSLKKFKNKVRKTKLIEELKERKQFTKKSVRKRHEKIGAAFKEKFKN